MFIELEKCHKKKCKESAIHNGKMDHRPLKCKSSRPVEFIRPIAHKMATRSSRPCPECKCGRQADRYWILPRLTVFSNPPVTRPRTQVSSLSRESHGRARKTPRTLHRHRRVTLNGFVSEAHRALELLEDYHEKLIKPQDKQLRLAIERVIRIFKSRLFQALLGK